MAPLVQLIVAEVMALKPRCGRACVGGDSRAGHTGAAVARHARPHSSQPSSFLLVATHLPNTPRRFHVCLQQALAERNGSHAAEGDHDDSEEDAKGMARLFAEVGEAYTGLIAEAAPQVQAPVEALLDVASHPDDAICSISFNFWHRLSRALTIGLHPEPLGAHACTEGRGGLCVGTGGLGWGACCAMAGCWSAEPPPTHPPSHTTLPPAESEEGPVSDEERERRVRVFTPTLERLVALIRGRVRFHDNFESWHRDERQDFKRARCVAPGAGVCGMHVREGGCGGHQRPVAISGPPSHCPRIAASNRALTLLHLTALPPSPSHARMQRGGGRHTHRLRQRAGRRPHAAAAGGAAAGAQQAGGGSLLGICQWGELGQRSRPAASHSTPAQRCASLPALLSPAGHLWRHL